MALRFAPTIGVRLELSDGEWIEIRNELTAGIARQVNSSALARLVADDSTESGRAVTLDWKKMSVERVFAYLIAWSAKDDHGKPVKITRDAVAELDEASFDEIENAITKHVETRDKEKNATSGSGEKTPSGDSPSAAS